MELKDLLADEQFISEIIPLDSIEEVQKAFEEKGAAITIEQCEKLGAVIKRVIAVTDNETENISGGDKPSGFDKAVLDAVAREARQPTLDEIDEQINACHQRIEDALYRKNLQKAYQIGLGLGVALLPLGIYSSYKIGMYARKKIGNWIKKAKAEEGKINL